MTISGLTLVAYLDMELMWLEELENVWNKAPSLYGPSLVAMILASNTVFPPKFYPAISWVGIVKTPFPQPHVPKFFPG